MSESVMPQLDLDFWWLRGYDPSTQGGTHEPEPQAQDPFHR